MRRSAASTMPAELAPAPSAWMSDLPGWCVDRGDTLSAMTTCELWLALARGDVTPETKVWREGMPCWDAVARVPEFALAMPDARLWGTPVPPVPSVAPPAPVIPLPSVAPALAQEIETMPDSDRVVDVRTMAPASDLLTPAPVVVEQDASAAPPRSTRRRRPAPFDRRGILSMAVGALIAVTALALATAGTGASDAPLIAPAPIAASPVRANAAAAAPERGVELFAQPSPELAMTSRARAGAAGVSSEAASRTQVKPVKPAKQREPRGPHAGDRGQSRARSSSR
ncbi:MAG: DUF4339 domain-containing protein [Polyangiaceae bacterium]